MQRTERSSTTIRQMRGISSFGGFLVNNIGLPGLMRPELPERGQRLRQHRAQIARFVEGGNDTGKGRGAVGTGHHGRIMPKENPTQSG